MIFDLSAVTDALLKLVNGGWDGSQLWQTEGIQPFKANVTGLSPDAVRPKEGPQLSLYLYHVDENNATESLFWTSQSQTAGGPPHK